MAAPVTRLPRPLIKLLVAVKRVGMRVIRVGLVRYARAAPPAGGAARA